MPSIAKPINLTAKDSHMPLMPKLLTAAVVLALAGTASAASIDGRTVERALGLLQTHGSAAYASPNDKFIARDAIIDADGSEHVRFDRTYAGLPVIGGDVVVHSRNGQLLSTSMTQRKLLNLVTRPTIRPVDAIAKAGAIFGTDFSAKPEIATVIYARGEVSAQLAYQVRLDNDDSDMTFIVSARDGGILDRWSNRETLAATASGTGKTLFSGNQTLTTKPITGGFELRDPTRGGGYTINAGLGATSGQIYKDADNTWGNNTVTDPVSAAADAQFGMAVTWDYYKNVHGRNGIANNSQGAFNRVHYGRKYSNAYWADSCFCMTYGDGDGVTIGPLVTLDIAGHEMSHGVMARTANLTYSGESGGLNEANSDIFGTMVEFYANNAVDTPDYMIGEEIFAGNVSGSADQSALRYMFNPGKDGQSPDCYYPTIGTLDVHYSSGVANHFYYLLAEGSGPHTYSGVNHRSTTCNASSLTGITRAKAEKIWYRAISVYMTSSTNYAGARVATLNAAADLYGPSSTERAAVAATWSAVGVN
jgi:Zn-dependent metalloprotease